MNEVRHIEPEEYISNLYSCLKNTLSEEKVLATIDTVDMESVEHMCRAFQDEKIKKKAQCVLLILKALQNRTRAHTETLCFLNRLRKDFLSCGVKESSKHIQYLDTFYKIFPDVKEKDLPTLQQMAQKQFDVRFRKISKISKEPKEILDLSDSILKKVFSQLLPSDIPNVALTCKRFLHIFEDPTCLSSIFQHNSKILPLIKDMPCIRLQPVFCKMIANSLQFEEITQIKHNFGAFTNLFSAENGFICVSNRLVCRFSVNESVTTTEKFNGQVIHAYHDHAFLTFDFNTQSLITKDMLSGEMIKPLQTIPGAIDSLFDQSLPLLAIKTASGVSIYDYSGDTFDFLSHISLNSNPILFQHGSVITRTDDGNLMRIFPDTCLLENTKDYTPLLVAENELLFCMNRRNTIKAIDMHSRELVLEFNIMDYTRAPITSCHMIQGVLFTTHNNVLCAWNLLKKELIKSFPFSEKIIKTSVSSSGIFVLLKNNCHFAKF